MRTTLRLTVAACCLWGGAQPALAQQASSQPAAAPAAATPPITPEIRAAIDRMAAAMKAQQSFGLTAELTTEEVLEDGQKIQSSSTMTASARRPDRLFVDIASARRNRQFYYDGKSVTLYGPATKYYASVPAPPTTASMLHEVADRYALETPLLDLFEWGSSGVKLNNVTSAMYAGPDRIGGKVCDQYAFRQQGVDWQLWIPTTEPALPCKMVIVDTEDPSHPQFTAVFNWTPNAQFGDDRFSFKPPQGAHRIALTTADAPAQQKGATK